MTEIAEAARGLPDARVRRLIDWIARTCVRTCRKPGPPAGTEHPRDLSSPSTTTRSVTCTSSSRPPSRAPIGPDERIAIYPRPDATGGARGDQAGVQQPIRHKHPLRILIATDAAREGLNLQAHCWNLFHFDVPWNPSRMEQRNGRIDRKLQPKRPRSSATTSFTGSGRRTAS